MVDRGRQTDKIVFKYKALPRWDNKGNPIKIKNQ